MTSTKKDPVVVVLQLTGGNDYYNTIIPYNDPLYQDNRPNVKYPTDEIIKINDNLGMMPNMGPIKELYDQGKVAIIHGAGYADSPRSHFRSMDIWATCEPEELGVTGWLGSVIQDVDPTGENVLTGVNFGRGLPRSLAKEGVAVASVGDLSTYGLLTDMDAEAKRTEALDLFGRMYAPAIGQGAVDDYIRRTGIEALKGADILTTAPGMYRSEVEYASSAMGGYLRDMAQVHNAEFGTRVMFTTAPYNIFDTHANQAVGHANLLQDVAVNVDSFMTDIRQLGKSDNVTLFFYSEFGRRAMDNGSGTDHGTGGVAFVIGDHVKGGLYGEYPSLDANKLEDGGNLQHNVDFRSAYTTLLDRWMGLDAKAITGGTFEPVPFL